MHFYNASFGKNIDEYGIYVHFSFPNKVFDARNGDVIYARELKAFLLDNFW
jgi:hypothetical protein